MSRKRDRTPEALLQMVVTEVEREPQNVEGARAMVRQLLTDGPLGGADAVKRATGDEFADLWGELTVFLRSLVAARPLRPTTIPIRKQVVFTVDADRDGATIAATGTLEDLVVLNVIWLLKDVGLRNVRRCQAPDCPRLFVKRHKTVFCSKRCQMRTSKRAQRQRERDADEQQTRRRRRAARGGR